MIVFQFYQKSETVTMVELQHGRLKNIHTVVYLPLFESYDIQKLDYPTRQQMHSKRNYISNNYTFIQETKRIGIKNAIEIAKELICKNGLYENNC